MKYRVIELKCGPDGAGIEVDAQSDEHVKRIFDELFEENGDCEVWLLGEERDRSFKPNRLTWFGWDESDWGVSPKGHGKYRIETIREVVL